MVRHMDRDDFALRDVGQPEMKRLRGDLNGYVATGTSVLMFDEALAGTVAVTELVHTSNGRHAYAKSAAEITTWQRPEALPSEKFSATSPRLHLLSAFPSSFVASSEPTSKR